MNTRQERAAKQLRELFAPGKDDAQRRWLLSLLLQRTFVLGTQAGIRIGKPASTIRDAFSVFSKDESTLMAANIAPILLELINDYWRRRDEDGSFAQSLFVTAQLVGFFFPESFGSMKNALKILATHSNFDLLPLNQDFKKYWKSF